MSISETNLEQAAKMRGMSPRSANRLPDDVVDRLREAQQVAAEADAAFKDTIRAALKHGSVRQVAAALGMSPTTVQKWSAER